MRHKIKDAHVCLEATGRYSDAVARSLHEAAYEVSIVNPAQIRSYVCSQLRRSKTDHLKAGTTVALVIEQLQVQIELLSQQIKAVKEAIDRILEQNPKLQTESHLLLSIPGIEQLAAAKILAEFPQMESFQNVRQLVVFAGLNPRHCESGSSIHGYTCISKMGRSRLRAALYMPALTAMRFNPRFANYAQGLRDRGLKGKAVVVAIMRKLLYLAYGILKSGRAYDPECLDKMLTVA